MIKSEIKITLTGKLEVGGYSKVKGEEEYNGNLVFVDNEHIADMLSILDGENVTITIEKKES